MALFARYVVDTCSFIEMRQRYPKDVFPGVWDMLDSLVRQGFIAAPDKVLQELSRKDDELHEWARAHKDIFRALDRPAMEEARRIAAKYDANGRNRFVDLKKPEAADLFVVALASTHRLIVVTEEKSSPSGRRIKIPDVCEDEGIECIGLVEMFRREGLRL